MHVCLIWQLIPESTEVYFFDLEGEELEKIKACHGLYLNADESEALDWLNEFLVGQEKESLVQGKPLPGNFDLIVISGFIL